MKRFILYILFIFVWQSLAAGSISDRQYLTEVLPGSIEAEKAGRLFVTGSLLTLGTYTLERGGILESRKLEGFMPAPMASVGNHYISQYWFLPAMGFTMLAGEQDLQGGRSSLRYAGTSLAATAAVTYTLKRLVNRQRPSGYDYSFPSGHSSASWAAASIIDGLYGINYAWPFYLMAVNTALSRVNDGVHYPSDILFGSLLGYVIPYALRSSENSLRAEMHSPVLFTLTLEF